MIDDLIEGFCISITVILTMILTSFLLLGIIFGITEIVKSINLYQYECITIDNETITCDKIKESESGIIGTRDDTSYLIKQYKKIEKEVEDD